MLNASSRKKNAALVVCLAYNLVNSALLSLFIREALIIRGDGPGGFGELILKLFMSHVAIALLAMGLITSIKAYRAEKRSGFPTIACVVSTSVLLGFSVIAVMEACIDDAGHCRDWHWYI